jgi:hypothetical protein
MMVCFESIKIDVISIHLQCKHFSPTIPVNIIVFYAKEDDGYIVYTNQDN